MHVNADRSGQIHVRITALERQKLDKAIDVLLALKTYARCETAANAIVEIGKVLTKYPDPLKSLSLDEAGKQKENRPLFRSQGSA